MNSFVMLSHIWRIVRRICANVAFPTTKTPMYAYVTFKWTVQFEWLAAFRLRATEWSFGRVYWLNVALHVGLLRERLATILTIERFLGQMNTSVMTFHGVHWLEALQTCRAIVLSTDFIARVRVEFVSSQRTFPGKPCRAFIAIEWLLLRVNTLMWHQGRIRACPPIAVGAFMTIIVAVLLNGVSFECAARRVRLGTLSALRA